MTGPSSNPRPRLDDLTDDMLDALYAELWHLRLAQEGAALALQAAVRKTEEQRRRAEQAEAAIARVRAELNRIANLGTITHDDGHADTFSTGARWAIRIIRENVLGEQADRTPPVHIGNRVNAEDCPGCSGTNLPYPFICPAQPGDPGGPYPTA